MKQRLPYVLLCLAMFSCGVMPRGGGRAAQELGAFTPDSIPAEHQAAYLYAEGIKAAAVREDTAAAKGFFERALAADTAYAPAYFGLATLLLDENEPQQAIQYSLRANQLDTTNITYRSQLAQATVMTGDYDQALRIYTQLLADDPHNVMNYRLLAALYDFRGERTAAISILDSAEYKLGRREELTEFKRELLIGAGMTDKALEETDALINAYPHDERNYLIKAELLKTARRDSAALANYREAIRINPTNLNTLLSLADFYERRNDNAAYLDVVRRIFESDDFPLDRKVLVFNDLTISLDYYRANYLAIGGLATTLIAKYPEDLSVVKLYATHLVRSAEIEKALELYKSYVGRMPAASTEPYFIIMEIEMYLERPDSVMKYADTALIHFPDESDVHMRRGYLQAQQGNNREALKDYKAAYKCAPDDTVRSNVAGIIGDHYHTVGSARKTYSYYRKALELNPDNYTVLNNYAYYLSEDGGDLEKALSMSLRATELDKGNATFLDTLGWIYYKLGRYAEAKKYMQQALSLDASGSDVLMMHYGDILSALGEDFLAKAYWRKALEAGADAEEVRARLNPE